MQASYLSFPDINPIILQLGPLALRWYGLMYLLGFLFAWWWGNRQCQKLHYSALGWSKERFSDVLFYGFLGVIVGGRVGYVLFYQFDRFIADPSYLFSISQGGMSFHGGFLGVVTVLALFARKMQLSLLQVGDFIAPLVPIGLGLGRIGNFINGELWGRVSDVPWAMVFPTGGALPRHPSQLYQAGLEGLLLFVVLAWYSSKPRASGRVSAVFLVGYGCARFLVEFFREPDRQLGYLTFGLTMGQWLSAPMIIAGIALWFYAPRLNVNQAAKK